MLVWVEIVHLRNPSSVVKSLVSTFISLSIYPLVDAMPMTFCNLQKESSVSLLSWAKKLNNPKSSQFSYPGQIDSLLESKHPWRQELHMGWCAVNT